MNPNPSRAIGTGSFLEKPQMSIRQRPNIGDRVSVVDMFRKKIIFTGTLVSCDDELAEVSGNGELFPCLPEELRKERRQ